jgi:hypothetical protein
LIEITVFDLARYQSHPWTETLDMKARGDVDRYQGRNHEVLSMLGDDLNLREEI